MEHFLGLKNIFISFVREEYSFNGKCLLLYVTLQEIWRFSAIKCTISQKLPHYRICDNEQIIV